MYRGESRLLPAILIIIVTIVAIFALVTLGRAIFSRNSGQVEADDSAKRALLTTDPDRSVRMTVRGPIVSDEDFRSYTIEVSPISRRMTTYSGFENTQLDNKQFDNNTEAYTEFVNALQRAGFTKGTVTSIDNEENMRGICAGGRLYTFELAQSQSLSQQLWTTSCRNTTGTFRGAAADIRTLFLRQIPGSSDMLRSIDL